MTIGPVRAGLGNINLHMPSTAPSTTRQAEQVDVGAQVSQILFGKPKPPPADPAKFPQLAELMRRLKRFKAKFSNLAGDEEEDYDIYLAHGTIACIDSEGEVAVGVEFLEAFKDHPEVIAGVLAHEIGHRPKRWKEYQSALPMTREEVEELCRFEETRADLFAGRALAELGLSYNGMIRLLMVVQPEDQPHLGYHPAPVRARIIKEAFQVHLQRMGLRKRLFPEMERHHSAGGYIGKG